MLIVDTDTKVTQNVSHILLKITVRFYLSIMGVCQCYSYLLYEQHDNHFWTGVSEVL